MPTQSKSRRAGAATAPKRDVSPLGASKFERPYSPPFSANTSPILDPPRQFSEPSPPRTSIATSHTSPSLPDGGTIQFSKPSLASTLPTTHGAASTPSSSVDRFEQALDAISNSSCPLPEDREAWFLRQTEESDLNLPIDIAGDECPDGATLAAVRDIPLYDAEGNTRPFSALYDPSHTPNQRQLIIFIRHFYCGACQAFVKALTEGITMEDYFSIPVPTSIILIGCGAPDLIPQYKKFTHGCHFPIFAEPTRKLFKTLGMSTLR